MPLLKPETLQKLYNEHSSSKASCTILTSIMDDPGSYGRILRNASGEITGIVEFKDATEEQRAIKEWNTGIYCFQAGDMFDALKQTSSVNNQNEYYLTDVVSVLAKQGKKISSVILDNPIEVAGVNSQEQLAELEDLFIAEIRKLWLNNGVVIHNPRTVYIGEEVDIEPDVEIGQNSIIRGKSELRKGAYIGPNCYIEDTVLCDSSFLEGYNILVNAHIPEGHILDFGERTILNYKGANEFFSSKEIPVKKINARWLFLGSLGKNPKNLEFFLELKKRQGIKMAINPGKYELSFLKNYPQFLSLFDIFICNQEEASYLSDVDYLKEGLIFQKLDSLIKGVVVMTKGKKGVSVSDGQYLYSARIVNYRKFIKKPLKVEKDLELNGKIISWLLI